VIIEMISTAVKRYHEPPPPHFNYSYHDGKRRNETSTKTSEQAQNHNQKKGAYRVCFDKTKTPNERIDSLFQPSAPFVKVPRQNIQRHVAMMKRDGM
jgi:hypothetical protein